MTTSKIFVGYGGGESIASDIVLDGWQTQQEFTKSTYSLSMEALQNLHTLGQELGSIPNLNEELGELANIVSPFQKPDKPTSETAVANFVTIDTDVNLVPVDTLQVPAELTLDAESPDYVEPTIPSAFNKAAPIAPSLGVHEYPDAPIETIPSAPSLRDIILPDSPNLIDIQFEGRQPDQLEVANIADFVFTDFQYSSNLLSDIVSELRGWVDNRSTGVGEAIRQQNWDSHRRKARVAAESLDTQLKRSYASSGFNLPGDDLVRLGFEAAQNAVNIEAEASRDIAIAEAELEQKNLHFAFTTATQIEGILINHFDTGRNRALDAAKFTVQSAIQLRDLKVKEHNLDVETYRVYADVYEARLRGELTKLEQFKAELDGQKLIGELNQQDIAIYSEQIKAVLAIYELYRSKLEAVKTKLQGDELIIRQFDSEINAYETEIKAKGLEFEQAKLSSDIQLGKSEFYKNQTDAFAKLNDARKTTLDGRIAKQNADIRLNQEIPLEVLKEKAAAGKSMIDAESARLRAITDTNKANAEIFGIETSSEAERIKAEVAVQENEIRKLIAEAEIRIESQKGNISSMLAQKEMLLDIARAVAQIASQLTAAVMSTVNLSASTGESSSTSHSYSKGDSSSTSVSHSVDDTGLTVAPNTW